MASPPPSLDPPQPNVDSHDAQYPPARIEAPSGSPYGEAQGPPYAGPTPAPTYYPAPPAGMQHDHSAQVSHPSVDHYPQPGYPQPDPSQSRTGGSGGFWSRHKAVVLLGAGAAVVLVALAVTAVVLVVGGQGSPEVALPLTDPTHSPASTKHPQGATPTEATYGDTYTFESGVAVTISVEPMTTYDPAYERAYATTLTLTNGSSDEIDVWNPTCVDSVNSTEGHCYAPYDEFHPLADNEQTTLAPGESGIYGFVFTTHDSSNLLLKYRDPVALDADADSSNAEAVVFGGADPADFAAGGDVIGFDTSYTFDSGFTVTIGAPVPYDVGIGTIGAEYYAHTVKSVVTIVNNSGAAVSPPYGSVIVSCERPGGGGGLNCRELLDLSLSNPTFITLQNGEGYSYDMSMGVNDIDGLRIRATDPDHRVVTFASGKGYSGDPQESAPSPSHAPAATRAFGETYAFANGVEVTLGIPVQYTPTDHTARSSDLSQQWKVPITVTNRSGQEISATSGPFFIDCGESGKCQSTVDFDLPLPSGKVPDGGSYSYEEPFRVDSEQDLTFILKEKGGSEQVVFTWSK